MWTIWTSLSAVPRKAVKFNHSLTCQRCWWCHIALSVCHPFVLGKSSLWWRVILMKSPYGWVKHSGQYFFRSHLSLITWWDVLDCGSLALVTSSTLILMKPRYSLVGSSATWARCIKCVEDPIMPPRCFGLTWGCYFPMTSNSVPCMTWLSDQGRLDVRALCSRIFPIHLLHSSYREHISTCARVDFQTQSRSWIFRQLYCQCGEHLFTGFMYLTDL